MSFVVFRSRDKKIGELGATPKTLLLENFDTMFILNIPKARPSQNEGATVRSGISFALSIDSVSTCCCMRFQFWSFKLIVIKVWMEKQ